PRQSRRRLDDRAGTQPARLARARQGRSTLELFWLPGCTEFRMISRRASLGLIGAAALTRPALAKDVDVAIVGAGPSGLIGALNPEVQGQSGVLVEAKNRVGGRCYTFTDLPGAPEAGGQSVGSMYARFLDWCDRLGVKRSPEEAGGAGWVYHIKGQNILR